MIIKGFRLGPLLRCTGREILDDGVLGLAAQTAYYFFFSLFPMLLFVAPLLSFVGDKQELVGNLLSRVGSMLPGSAMELVQGVVTDVVFAANAPGLMSVGALLAAWAGSNIFTSLIDALNRAYDVTETRPWWKRRLLALASVVVAALVVTVATIILLGGQGMIFWVTEAIGLGESGQGVWRIVQLPLAVAMLVGLAWMIYYFLPNVRQDKTQVLAGTLATTLLWLLVTAAFRLYVQNFGSYNKTYGAIGGVIALLTWMYLSMLVVLAGGELNSELHHGTGAVDPRRGVTLSGRITTGIGAPSTPHSLPLATRAPDDEARGRPVPKKVRLPDRKG